jgi:hypothetical protein
MHHKKRKGINYQSPQFAAREGNFGSSEQEYSAVKGEMSRPALGTSIKAIQIGETPDQTSRSG